jgi:hypothetical protein
MDVTDAERFAPGTHGCHEALHMASFLMEAVAERLMEHKAIEQKPEWAALADRAHQALFDLYQAIGKEHL